MNADGDMAIADRAANDLVIVYDSNYAFTRLSGNMVIDKNGGLVGVARVLRKRIEDRGTQIHWVWIKGHSHHPANDRADKLATQGMFEPLKCRYRFIPPSYLSAAMRFTCPDAAQRAGQYMAWGTPESTLSFPGYPRIGASELEVPQNRLCHFRKYP